MKAYYTFIIILFAMTSILHQPAKAAERPKIIGVSHACFYTTDMARTSQFFTDYLGFEIAQDGLSIPACTIIKFNDRQFIELFPDPEGTRNQAMHYCLETDDSEAWRIYLKELGYKVPEEPLTPGRTGNLNFFVPMPGGVACEFIQYLPTGMIAQTRGKYLPENPISNRLGHVGFMVDDMDKVHPFYTEVFGMKETWRGGPSADVVKWVHIQLPESEQTVEYMLYDKEPSKGERGVMNHICLLVEDVYAAQAVLETRTLPEGCRNTGISLGADNKRQLNLYTHEGIRVELVEDHFTDGIPAPSSTGKPAKFVKE
ncbi:catechol 2,3-dioxygenase-like lactoylglutathione lyase family enzyme [Parabacteroides sp. PFB2-10]|uniref:VOC family protein n=1 Tax=Parabacteroides sp. PFB2-10 TaxID=1742405 RepID=UPI00247615B1|nr:VOC family protein [Parabacteroides sp. PFB2-10]MDH6314275.1 catechol 2,3-dioxygenase-like lactoylglutathione lyase family enzyme [Parabacteroides sp. PFB2-10]